MGTRRGPASIAATLATAADELRLAVRASDPAEASGLAQLRDTGWQLTRLTGELTDLVALLAEHTGHHIQHPQGIICPADGATTEHLARACRELAALRHALDTAHTASRDYYTAISLLSPAGPDSLRPSP